MAVRSLAVVMIAGTAILPSFARAQDVPVEPTGPEAPPQLALRLRPAEELRPLARRVAAMMTRRGEVPVELGDPPPGGIAEAIRPGEVALVREGEVVQVVLGGRQGMSYGTELTLRAIRSAAAARAVALAIETLRDTMLVAAERGEDVPPPAGARREPRSRIRTRWIIVDRAIEQDGEPWHAPRRLPQAKPTLFLRFLLGWSPVQRELLIGPGAGLGLCVGPHCVVIEADLPLMRNRTQSDFGEVRYRAVNTSMRVIGRPFRWGDFTPGFGLGLLTRIGSATLRTTHDTRVVTNLGMRLTVEMAWAFAGPFELVAEGGLDYAVSRARFIHGGRSVYLEDRWTPWLVTSLRLRPGADRGPGEEAVEP
jgi:hypothetical protein